MTTLENRPNTALLVVDVQNGVVEGAHERDEVVANVGSLVEKARREQIPVVWVQHTDEQLAKGSDRWRIVPELKPGAGVVTTRGHVHWVVTEHGVADLAGKTLAERRRALVELAHPEDREALLRSSSGTPRA